MYTTALASNSNPGQLYTEAQIRQLDPSNHVPGVNSKSLHYMLRLNEIIRFVADNNYCWIHFATGTKIIVAKTLKAVSDKLPTSGFLRVHRSHIVRKDEIHHVFKDRIVLHNGETIPLARRSKKYVNQQLADIAG